MLAQEFATPSDALVHFGVKGMRWGIRKEALGSPDSLGAKGVTFGRDGSITMEKGASLQRLVRANGKSLPMKDLTYASTNAYDNAKYIKTIGGKGFLGGGRDTILSIRATQPIKAPGLDESTRIVSGMLVRDATFRKKNTDPLGNPITPKELKKIADDPTGKTAKAWYDHTNTKLTFDKEYDPDAPYVQKRFREEFAKEGYNAVRDENDVRGKIAKAPIIIFSPEKSLKVVGTTKITDEIRKSNKTQLKQYKSTGKDWVERELYGS